LWVTPHPSMSMSMRHGNVMSGPRAIQDTPVFPDGDGVV